MNQQDLDCLQVFQVLRSLPSLGRTTVFRLYQAWQNRQIKPEAILGLHASLIAEKLLSQKQYETVIKSFSEQKKLLIHALAQFRDIRLIWFHDLEYPPLLRHSDNPPAFLYARGASLDWQEAIVIGIVGARNMTSYGEMVTKKIAGELAQLGAIVVSGLMYGVDTTAHLACLNAGGQTVAVLGYGFNHCYPEDHAAALDEVLVKGGTLLTEYPPWQPAIAGQFPARNTIVAGMCQAIVVTEAAEQSGTMITVQYALDNGRSIFAIPGPIDNPYTSGTRYLINQGATLVASGEEVVREIA